MNSTQDAFWRRGVVLTEERAMATRADCHVSTFADASHGVGIVRHAAQFAALIERAAAAG